MRSRPTFAPVAGHREDEGGMVRSGSLQAAVDNPQRASATALAHRERLTASLIELFQGAAVQAKVSAIPVLFHCCPKCDRIGPFHGAAERPSAADNAAVPSTGFSTGNASTPDAPM
jgi:hypothetical protein